MFIYDGSVHLKIWLDVLEEPFLILKYKYETYILDMVIILRKISDKHGV